MPYDSKAIANYFLDLAERDGKKLDPMQIQKLVYFAHGWNLALNGVPLIEDTVEAWRYGPVIPTLYHSFKQFGSGPITSKAKTLMLEGNDLYFATPSIEECSDTKANGSTKALLDRIWEVYGGFSGIQLSNMTHGEGTPWEQTWSKFTGRKGKDIDDDVIRQYFVTQMNARAAQ